METLRPEDLVVVKDGQVLVREDGIPREVFRSLINWFHWHNTRQAIMYPDGVDKPPVDVGDFGIEEAKKAAGRFLGSAGFTVNDVVELMEKKKKELYGVG